MRYVLLVLAALVSACEPIGPDSAYRALDEAIASHGGSRAFVLPTSLVGIPHPEDDGLTYERFLAGMLAYYEPELLLDSKVESGDALGESACATCHHPETGMGAAVMPSVGEGGVGVGRSRRPGPAPRSEQDIPGFRSPRILAAAWMKAFLHDGAVTTLEDQADKAVTAHRVNIDSVFFYHQGFAPYARAAYPGLSDDSLRSRTMLLRYLADYQRGVVPFMSRLQRYLLGFVDALSPSEARGATTFFELCVGCHAGPALTDSDFHYLPGFPRDSLSARDTPGRMRVSGDIKDAGAFRTPTLYNLVDDPVYGAAGQIDTIEDAIAGHEGAEGYNPVPEEDLLELVSFLRTGIRDTKLRRYLPDSVLTGHCFPNRDDLSIEQTGCDL